MQPVSRNLNIMDARFPNFVPFLHNHSRVPRADARAIAVAGRDFPVDLRRHPRARRYVLRLTADGRLALTVPRGASITNGLQFARRQERWIEREWRRQQARTAEWDAGTELWYRGERVALAIIGDAIVVGDQTIPARDRDHGVRTIVERHLRQLAAVELPARSRLLAEARAIPLGAVRVRNQRTRWGSCSPRGAIALNWRLIQMPPEVTDYVILHELAHRRHPDHSSRFWREVESLCPRWRSAERWLRKNGRELL
jgi:predicted metal-dependent hydrolase